MRKPGATAVKRIFRVKNSGLDSRFYSRDLNTVFSSIIKADLFTGSNRVKRGGSWNNNASNCTVSYRYYGNPYGWNTSIGFRLVRSAQ